VGKIVGKMIEKNGKRKGRYRRGKIKGINDWKIREK